MLVEEVHEFNENEVEGSPLDTEFMFRTHGKRKSVALLEKPTWELNIRVEQGKLFKRLFKENQRLAQRLASEEKPFGIV